MRGASTCADDHANLTPAHVSAMIHDVALPMMIALPLGSVSLSVSSCLRLKRVHVDVHPVHCEEGGPVAFHWWAA